MEEGEEPTPAPEVAPAEAEDAAVVDAEPEEVANAEATVTAEGATRHDLRTSTLLEGAKLTSGDLIGRRPSMSPSMSPSPTISLH